MKQSFTWRTEKENILELKRQALDEDRNANKIIEEALKLYYDSIKNRSEISRHMIEMIEELGKINVQYIDNLGKLIAELKDMGYMAYLDESTDYLIVERIE
jgi:hypothetical protein